MKIHSKFTHRRSSAVHLSLRSRLAPGLACFAAAIAIAAPHAVAQAPAPGPRELPANTVPVPDTVSPQMLYTDGRDLKDPMLSPVYGDMRGFPPAILTTGTRDLLLSNTVRVHRKLRQAGVEAALQVFEGQSHAQYYRDVAAPETKEAFTEIARFFDKHLGK
jgi:acetyl esterase/lipase